MENPKTTGLFKLYWTNDEDKTDGGSSLASVGMCHNGVSWYAPTNWTTENNDIPRVASTDWSRVERIERIEPATAWNKASLEDYNTLADLLNENEIYEWKDTVSSIQMLVWNLKERLKIAHKSAYQWAKRCRSKTLDNS